MTTTVAAVVPTYRPDASELLSLVAALAAAAVPALVVDDASPCTSDTALDEVRRAGTPVIRHRHNAGIARSLNDGLQWAAQHGATWLLTLDQDSTMPPSYVEALLTTTTSAAAALGVDRVGAVAAGEIADESGRLGYPLTYVAGIPTTDEVIQTGTLWSIDAMLAAGGFDERLGIDAVDAAACLALRSAGMRIAIAPDVAVGHRLGAARQVRVLGRDIVVSGHSPERRTSILRNRLRLFPAEFAQSPKHAIRTLRRVGLQTALAVTVEDNRWEKAKASARALRPAPKR